MKHHLDPDISIAENLRLIARKQREKEKSIDVRPVNLTPKRQKQYIDNKNKKADIRLKKRFAHYFKVTLATQLITMNIIFIFVGFGILKFSDYTINLYMTGTLIEIFGIVCIMVRYLFSSH